MALAFRADRTIALVGLMAAGKTTVGARLAARLGLPFADSDAAVEQAAGLSVADLFERMGEAAFRERERHAIAELANGPPCVLAAGGGAFSDAPTRQLMLQRCTVVWLDADVQTLAGRLAQDRKRPLLRGRDPLPALAELARQREADYAQAPLRVSAELPVEAIVEQIATLLAARS